MSGKAVRETLGFLAVVASLVFVGLEIRQNTQVARAEAYRDVAIFTTDLAIRLAEDPEFQALYSRMQFGDAGGSAFTNAEQIQAAWRFDAVFRQAELIWRQVESGVLPPEAIDLMLNFTLDLRFAREIWPLTREDLPADFAAAFMDQRMSCQDGTAECMDRMDRTRAHSA